MKRIIVFYDGWCSICLKSIKSFKRFDWLNRIEFISFRNKKVIKKYNLDEKMLEKRIHSLKQSNSKYKMENGIHSINRICKNSPALWIFVPFLSFAALIGLGQLIYDWIASRRTIFPTGQCEDGSCQIPQLVLKNTQKK
ncbi:thiol-disulfide oxidoreductase DCC family protein [Viridibacillus sp. NPDC093762]|uniref:thiol-disulfide oxidoreductase DCC family protein n=1 Tax=Viridibacillus sp. NPDC093762 TaxID=3390720 RepID=UPI003D000F80